jgi:tetratricopeptide (TPR) repeat protein
MAAFALVTTAFADISKRMLGPERGNATEPLFDGLGSHHRKVTTKSADAQRYFDQGLCFLYAFNHDEAIRSFEQAVAFDPHCAMAWWGIAIAKGPHINRAAVSKENSAGAWKALRKAQENLEQSSETEKELIAAAAKRYSDPPPDDRKPLDQAFAKAMRQVWQAHPEDADVGALFAESMMDLRPWDFWTDDGKPQPGTEEILQTLSTVLKTAPNHPLALHLTIHALEASPHPEKADAAGDRLRNLQPALGHMVHMPSHLDVRRGRWEQAVRANVNAIEADRKYRTRVPQQDFYRLYMAHNHCMLAYAATMRGQSKLALETIMAMIQSIPPAWVKENAPIADMVAGLPMEILVRFGLWDEILASPEPPDFLPIARTLRHAARGVAFAAKGDLEKARAEQKAFQLSRAKIPAEAPLGKNKALDVMVVADRLLNGEILYRAGQTSEGIAALQEAVKQEDKLHYAEPPDWIHPVRHALGATLLREGRAQDAERVYREDLAKLPENGWSLYGLARSLRLQGKNEEAGQYEKRFREIWKDADVKITSSCFCQPEER